MSCSIPYNRFFQANFSKAQILIDFFVHKKGSATYDEYIRQGIEDLVQNIDTKEYTLFLQNMDNVLHVIHVSDADFTDVAMMILFLLSYILSIGKEYLNEHTSEILEKQVKYLNGEELETEACRVYYLDTFDWYLGYHRSQSTPVIYACANRKLYPVPFVCPSGAFGYNTFLCLYFHELAPIGFATNLNPKLHVVIESVFEAADHDTRHYSKRYCQIPLEVNERYRNIYSSLLQGYNQLTEDAQRERRKYLFFLFFLINEIAFGRRNLRYKTIEGVIEERFYSISRDEVKMELKSYRRKFLVDVEDLVPVLAEDLKIMPEELFVEGFDPYQWDNMGDYVKLSLLEILRQFQSQFHLFEK